MPLFQSAAAEKQDGKPGTRAWMSGEGWREPTLQETPARYRIAMVAFDDPPRLWRAASDLLLNSFAADQFCLIGSPRALGRLEPPPALVHRLQLSPGNFLSEPSAMIDVADAAEVAMKCGRRVAALFTPVGGHVYRADWLRPQQVQSLAGNVETGAIVLLAAANTAGQQAAGARLLLRHGTDSLQTNEFSMMRR